jgi:endonuclease/exonuclease/phosphatase (EEP) superfamily protein YafD
MRRLVAFLAVAYPVALVLVAASFRFIGEKWWPTAVGLYLPRIAFGAPLPLIVLALLLLRMRRLLVTQLVAAMVLLFPLMGFVAPTPVGGGSGKAGTIRVLSFNVNSGFSGYKQVAEQVARYSPDVVFLQEVGWDSWVAKPFFEALFPTVETSSQFLLATRFPVTATTDPDRLPYFGRERSPRFMRHIIETPIGSIVFYNVHPLSPRDSFYAVRGAGLRHEILSGRIFSGAASPAVYGNAGLRTLQAEAIYQMAAQDTSPIVIAGDTNMPGLSHTFNAYLGHFQDGFREAGWGFGYTYPARRPWMRIDRIMANDELRFTTFEVGCQGASDHLCVVADLERKAR